MFGIYCTGCFKQSTFVASKQVQIHQFYIVKTNFKRLFNHLWLFFYRLPPQMNRILFATSNNFFCTKIFSSIYICINASIILVSYFYKPFFVSLLSKSYQVNRSNNVRKKNTYSSFYLNIIYSSATPDAAL